MARLQDCFIGGLLVLTVTVLLNTRPAEAANCTAESDCKNNGTCPSPDSAPCDCDGSAYKGDTCENECEVNGDCGTGGTCGTTSPKKCTCKDSAKEGPGCTNDKSGASAVTSFSLMSLCVILISPVTMTTIP